MHRSIRRLLLAAPLALLATACGGGEEAGVQDTAEPFDTIAPAPSDTTLVPGGSEPGPQPQRPES